MTWLFRTSALAQRGIVPLAFPLFLLLGLVSVAMAQGAPVSRDQPKSAVVISRVGGETVRFANESAFRELVVGQELTAGDVIRTGPTGALGLLFVDRTAMRLHPNTELAIKEVSQSQSALELTSGKVWARTPRQSATPVSVQTPSAAAAIRGTDWTLSVSTANVTSVFVFDGEVELSNARGAITAGTGSGASAAQGAAPQTVQVVTLAERQQMLLSVTPGAAADAVIRFEQSLAGQGAAPAAYREGIRLLRAARFDEAAALLDRTAASLDPERAAAARWIAAFARAEAGAPITNLPARGQRVDAFGRAYFAAYSGDLAAASAALGPLSDEPVALSEAVSFAVYLDRFDEAKRLLNLLQSAAPGSAPALSAEAIVAHIVNGNPSRAVTLYRQAVALEPENPFLLNRLAMAEREVGHPIEAEAALRRALALAPGDTNIQGNLVTVLLDHYQIREAQRIVDRLNETAPGSYTSLSSLAHLASRQGDVDFARAAALDSLAAQPAASENSILLAIAAHRAGDDIRAQQELDAAKRLDPNNPNIPAIRAAIALDYARADEAIVAALEADRLFRQNLAAERLSANRKSGSVMTAAFQNLGLTDWARDIADRSHDPLSASSLFSEALTPRASLSYELEASDASDSMILASETQGLLIDPLGAVSRIRFSDLVLKPFVDGEISRSTGQGDTRSANSALTLTGYGVAPVPLGFYLKLNEQDLDAERLSDEKSKKTLTATIVTEPSARLGLMAFYIAGQNEKNFPGTTVLPTPNETAFSDLKYYGTGATYRLRERDLLFFYTSAFEVDTKAYAEELLADELGAFLRSDKTLSKYKAEFAGLGYRSDDASGTWFAGAELSRRTNSSVSRTRAFSLNRFVPNLTETSGLVRFQQLRPDFGGRFNPELPPGIDPGPPPEEIDKRKSRTVASKLYLQRRQDFGTRFDLEMEAGLYMVGFQGMNKGAFAPRLAFGGAVAPGHRIRFGAIRNIEFGEETLGPITTLGLLPIAAPTDQGGSTDAIIFRYDGTFRDRFHISLEHQSLVYRNLSFDVGNAYYSFPVEKAEMQRTQLRGELWLGGGIGAFASIAATHSEVLEGFSKGKGLPSVPEREASLGFTWVHPSQTRLSARARYIGERVGDQFGTMLDPVWTMDASLDWEPKNKNMKLSIEALNIFGRDVQRSFDQGSSGRSFAVTGSIRF